MKILKTKKLYYNKWVYKVECIVQRAYPIKYKWPSPYNRLTPDLIEFQNAVQFLTGKDIQTRVESSHYNIFCNDDLLFNEILTKLKKWIFQAHQPENDAEKQFLLNNHRKIIRDKYFKDIYQYRVHIKNTLNHEFRVKTYEWLSKYDLSKVYMSGLSKSWLMGANQYSYDPFIYVSDSKMLSMIYLYLGDNIKTTDEFIRRDSINNISCQP